MLQLIIYFLNLVPSFLLNLHLALSYHRRRPAVASWSSMRMKFVIGKATSRGPECDVDQKYPLGSQAARLRDKATALEKVRLCKSPLATVCLFCTSSSPVCAKASIQQGLSSSR